MTTTHFPEPERWTDRLAGGASAEDRLGAVLRGARLVTAPAEALLARVDAGFVLDDARVVGGFRWRFALAAVVVVLAGGGTVGAARGPLRVWAERHGLVVPAAPSPAAREVRPAPRRTAARAVAPSLVVEPPGTVAPSLAAEPPGTVAPSLAVEPPGTVAPSLVVEPPVAAVALVDEPAAARAPLARAPSSRAPHPALAAATESPAAEEAAILRDVFHDLRAGVTPADRTLAALDDYDRRFPSGLLRAEARVARVEALLALGRRADGLALLDGWKAGDLPRRLRVARGELRAEAGRCADAATDFDVAVGIARDDELGGRALYGRASCALRTGDDAAAAAALAAYLDAQPDGPHTAEARRALERLAARSAPPSP
jgi:hypothetical protein